MKSRFAKITAAAMAVTMCLPMAASAAQEGSFETSFDVYSPVLTISVPTKLDVKVNPIADSSSDGVGKFTVASNSIDIMNASVDVEKDQAIPVNVTVKASVESAAEDVVTEYNTFTADASSMKKKIYLELSEANAAATIGAGKDDQGTALTPAFDTDKKLDLTKYAVATPAEYGSVTNKAAITKYGSLLSMNIGGPTTTDSTTGATFSTDATKVTATVGSFAVTGEANTNADWKTTDVRVAVTYNVKASKPVTVTTPSVATAPTLTAANIADVTIAVPNIGEATVMAVGVHNDESFGDYVWDADAYTVDYTTTAGTASIKIPKEDAGLKTFAEFKGTHDLVIGLSDGRMVVSTFTVQ